MEPSIEVIVLSDDEDAGEDDDHTGAPENSVFIVEDDDMNNEVSETSEILDEDMTITFTRKANLLPHARYDCTVDFSVTECNVSTPERENAAFCEQCFCYVCDQLASQCKFWNVPGFCHCNAHKRSVYWKSIRDKRIMGYLHELKFTFNPADLDSDLRRAETCLQDFSRTLALKYSAFLVMIKNPNRKVGCVCPCHSNRGRPAGSGSTNEDAAGAVGALEVMGMGCSRCYVDHQKLVIYDYTPVKEHVSAFLDEAMKENPKSGSVVVLGAVKLFITHCMPGTIHAPAITHFVLEMFWRAISMVQVWLVDGDFPISFIKQLQDFFQVLPLPPDLRKFRNSLDVLSWGDPLLSAVLKGQNVTGVRQVKGRRQETLHETALVVRTRVLKLQQQNRFRELARYLRHVRSDNAAKLQMMRDWVPLYLCKVGDYNSAMDYFFNPVYSWPASRLSPAQFGAYLTIFMTGHVPHAIPHPPQVEFNPYSQNVHPVQSDPLLSSTWIPITGGSQLKRPEVLKFALRVLKSNNAVFAHSESWVKVLKFANMSSPSGPDGPCLPEPDYDFLIRAKDATAGILSELNRTTRIHIPKSFQSGYPEQALLLLTTQALAWRLLHTRLKPILPIILTFKSNPWVMRWLFSSLVVQPQVLVDLLCVIVEELLDGRCRSLLRMQDTVEHFFIAGFLCLFFLEPCVVLHHNTYPTNHLLAKWNEFENPWQYHLRCMLEVTESSLNPDKQQILIQMTQWGLRQ